MYAVYISHPQVLIDPDVPVPEWGLSPPGEHRARLCAALPWVPRLRRIISSHETKAIMTGRILATAAGLPVEIVDDMHENDRSSTGFMPPAEFEKAADAFFAMPDQSFRGWERALNAQQRIVSAVENILATHDPALPLAFTGHGGVGTLLKCHLAGRGISRSGDQPAGGGNLFCFSLADRRLTCDWTPMETWQGWIS